MPCLGHRRCTRLLNHECTDPEIQLHRVSEQSSGHLVACARQTGCNIPICRVLISILSSLSSASTCACVLGSTGGHPAKKMAYLNMGFVPYLSHFRCSCNSIVAATVAPSEYPMMPSKGPRFSMMSAMYLIALSVLWCAVARPSLISSLIVSSTTSHCGNSRIRARTSSSFVFSTSLSGSMKR